VEKNDLQVRLQVSLKMLQYLIEEYLPGYSLPARRVELSNWLLDVATSTLWLRTEGVDPFLPSNFDQIPGIVAIRETKGRFLVLRETREEYRPINSEVTNEYLVDFHRYID
jgi:hypothetical protein